MGWDIAYFIAADDGDAATAERRSGGPLGFPTVVGERKVGWFKKEPIIETLGPAYDGFAVRGYEPLVIEIFGAILRGIPFTAVEKDPRFYAPVSVTRSSKDPDEEEPFVVSLTAGLQTALIAAGPEELRRAVAQWTQIEELQGAGWEDVNAEDHLSLVTRFRGLATQAESDAKRVYCYLTP